MRLFVCLFVYMAPLVVWPSSVFKKANNGIYTYIFIHTYTRGKHARPLRTEPSIGSCFKAPGGGGGQGYSL